MLLLIIYKKKPDNICNHLNLLCDYCAFHQEDACSSNPLPGFQQLERFCSLLVEIGFSETKLSLTTDQRNEIIDAWNSVEDHDKQPQRFHQLYRTHWGNTLYCRTKRDDLVEAAIVQKVKMAQRYAPAQQDISALHNRLMYTLVKLLWLGLPQGSSRSSPEKSSILKAYGKIQHCILVEDPVLSKMGIPLPKINSKTVRDFIRRQERLVNLQATKMPSLVILKTTSVSSEELPPAECQPSVLPPPAYPEMEYKQIPSTAGTKILKSRSDITAPAPKTPSPTKHNTTPLPQQKALSTIFKPLPRTPTTTTDTPEAPATSANTYSQPDTPAFWSRSCVYKRKKTDTLSEVGAKLSRVHHLPICTLCNQPTQGHKKYKKKNFCVVKMMSTSKGLENRVFSSYEDFMAVVDTLK